MPPDEPAAAHNSNFHIEGDYFSSFSLICIGENFLSSREAYRSETETPNWSFLATPYRPSTLRKSTKGSQLVRKIVAKILVVGPATVLMVRSRLILPDMGGRLAKACL